MPLRLAVSFVLLFALVVPRPARALDVAPWERVLVRHARGGNFDYAALHASPESQADLRAFLQSVAQMPETEGMASWINAYNATVIAQVDAHYPLRSVRDVPGFFDRTRHRIAGAERTLDDVENRILRPRFHDARVHVAINCAARSCPPLHGHAFRAETLDATLTQLARAFVASDRHVRIAGTRVEVSALLFWFQADFERDAGGSRWTWLRRYDATNRLAALPPTTTLTQRDYDWALNAR